jgi:hypothetical protein
MSNLDFDLDKPKEKSEDPASEAPIVESFLEKGYQFERTWWGWAPSSQECPNQSIFPADESPYWKTGDIPQEIQEEYSNDGVVEPCVQGWKLHLAVDKRDIEK